MRQLSREGTMWTVRESSATDAGTRYVAGCLIFDSEAIVRRVWIYPARWESLSDEQLWELMCNVSGISPRPRRSSAVAAAALLASPGLPHDRPAALEREAVAIARSLLAQIMSLRQLNDALQAENRALRDACQRERVLMRHAIEVFAASMYDDGLPPEQTLVRIRGIITGGMHGVVAADDPEAATILRDAVDWGISAYYRAA